MFVKKSWSLSIVLAAIFLCPLASAEIVDLRVDNPRSLPAHAVAMNCPVKSSQLTEILDRALKKRGIQKERWVDQKFAYSAGVICRQHESGQHLYMLRIHFVTELEGDISVAFIHQGFQTDAGLGGEEEIFKAFSQSLWFSLSDYVRQNKWD